MLPYEIDALLVLKYLIDNKIASSPINRAKSIWVYQFLAAGLLKACDEVKTHSQTLKNDENFMMQVFSEAIKDVELSSLFFSENIDEVVRNCIADILSPPLSFEAHDISSIQGYINQIAQYHSGKCMHYASLAMYYLLEANIKPLGSIWLYEKGSDAVGHNFIVIGIEKEEDYQHFADTDAIIFDYWRGLIFKARDAFKAGPLAEFDPQRIVSMYHVSSQDRNPFCLPLLNEQKRRECDRIESISRALLQALRLRAQSGEAVVAIESHVQDPDLDLIDLNNLHDLADNERAENISTMLRRLKRERADNAARGIQHAERFFSQEKKGRLPVETEHQVQQSALG